MEDAVQFEDDIIDDDNDLDGDEEETETEAEAVSSAAALEDWDSFSGDFIPEEAKSKLFRDPPPASPPPDISALPDAVVCGKPAFGTGDKIVIERRATVLVGRPYLDTKTYRVLDVDLSTGKVKLYDETLGQYAYDNWIHGVRSGYVYKFARAGVISSKKKRGRPKKIQTAPAQPAAVEAQPTVVSDPSVKKRRGRPAGVKNRPKDVIAAEKKAKSDEKRLKAAVKKAKKS